ncbi:MAG: substrate-binding domain-containing protein [Kiritimatiellae bacterium]|nr:substrate-binding domain-containing protein [Kiritimatiellia bacterium]
MAVSRTGIKVPTQIAILGVDNDELYCVNSRPTLSSVHPNHVELGRMAAESLDRMNREDNGLRSYFALMSRT